MVTAEEASLVPGRIAFSSIFGHCLVYIIFENIFVISGALFVSILREVRGFLLFLEGGGVLFMNFRCMIFKKLGTRFSVK